ncbi:MAG TPA: glycosyltransferase family 2 protein [Candidatus Saccharimonadales bacterium]|nr:glycosyltransferase family 2 protein [Candidatus Saccharimonadales bacterium]
MIKKPLVSVLVHTKNSKRTIEEHLQSIKSQTYKNIEIIAVDNNSTDKTVSILKKFTKHVYNFGPERSAQRNFAAKKAKGAYLFVPDSDMVLQKDVISQCVDLVTRDKKIKAVIVPEKSIGIGFWAKCKALERSFYIGDETIEAARFFDKTIFWEMGGYDQDLTGPEDWDLPQRIRKKYKIGRIKTHAIHDEGHIGIFLLMQKKYYYAKSLSNYLKKHSLSVTGRQMIYILRPAFYRNWKKLLKNPLLTFGIIVMLSAEQCAGFCGFMFVKLGFLSSKK